MKQAEKVALLEKMTSEEREAVRQRFCAKRDAYRPLYRRLTEKYRLLIHEAHPEVGLDSAFLCTHNFGNPEARRLMELHDRRLSQLCRREEREIERIPW